MIQRRPSWNTQFTFHGKKFFYNRIPFNNCAERAVEVPLAFDFLARYADSQTMLEVGCTLPHYENALSDALGIRCRCIVDKFEVGSGITNIDIMDLDPAKKYQTIVSISTVEHVGQNCTPTGLYGEAKQATDLEAPLKAIAKIYDLLAVGGHALVTIPFGKLIDGGWYVQASAEYLDLLVSRYQIPRAALVPGFLKQASVEPGSRNPHQLWIEAPAEKLRNIRYNDIWSGARAIAVIELVKLEDPFTLDLAVPPTPLDYEDAKLAKGLFVTVGLLRKLLR